MDTPQDSTPPVPSFMQNPGWEALQEEIRAGQQGKRLEARSRLDEIKAQLSAVAEIEAGVSALGTTASKEELFVLRRKHHRHASLEWLIKKPLTEGEVDEILALWSKLGGQPMLAKDAFISLAEAEEVKRKREEGQLETIRRLMQTSKISFGPATELPEASSLGSPLDDDEHAYVLSKWFFEENPAFRPYFYGMVFSEEEKTRLVWLFDEVKPQSFSTIARLKEGLARRFANGTGHEPLSPIRERAQFQGHPDRHQGNPEEVKPVKPRVAKGPKMEPPEDDELVSSRTRASGRKK